MDKVADLSTMKETVKETLLGSESAEEENQPSASAQATFETNALKDEATGEQYMGEAEFINAVAPEGEDYVS